MKLGFLQKSQTVAHAGARMVSDAEAWYLYLRVYPVGSTAIGIIVPCDYWNCVYWLCVGMLADLRRGGYWVTSGFVEGILGFSAIALGEVEM